MGVKGTVLLTHSRIIEKAFPQTDTRKVYSYYKNGLLKSLLTYAEGQLTTTESMAYDKNGNKTLWEQNGSTTKYGVKGTVLLTHHLSQFLGYFPDFGDKRGRTLFVMS